MKRTEHAVTRLQGELEIDHDRGVIYFHTTSIDIAEKYGTVTILRICQLTKPIPHGTAIEIMVGAPGRVGYWSTRDEESCTEDDD